MADESGKSPNKAEQAKMRETGAAWSSTRDREGHWMASETFERLPKIRRDFDDSRDPTIKAQRLALERSETQRREDQSGASGQSEQAEPRPAPPLSDQARQEIDRERAERAAWGRAQGSQKDPAPRRYPGPIRGPSMN